jgi:hypothetical protein
MTFNLFDFNSTGDYAYLITVMGQDVLINNQPARVLITNRTLNQNYNDKNISSLSPLKRGDLILYEGKQYLIISEESKRYSRWKGIMRLLPFSIKFNHNCNFINVDCFIDSPAFGVIDGKYLSTATGEINVHMQDNEYTQQIKINDRFMKYGQAFKVTGIDRMTQPGIIILNCQKDVVDPAVDDIVNDIAGGLSCSVTITNTKPIQIYEGETVQLTWDSKGAAVVFSSSDTSIATVDATGLVTGQGIGTATITCANATNSAIRDMIDVNVEEVPASFSINITSTYSAPNEIKLNQSKVYDAQVYNGSTLITDGSQPVTWELFADDQTSATTLATITAQDGYSCTVKNNDATSGYVQLKATLQSNSTVFAWLRIQMKPLF